jgi:3-oxoacyl-[acyl-carrier-protein] synthase III
MYNSKILGVGSFLPPNKVTNHDLEKIIDTNDEWIRQRSGIEARYWAPKEMGTVDLAEKASLEAVKNSGLELNDIDFIICASISNDADIPGTGCFLQARLGLGDVPTLDIRQQCSGFVYATFMANQFISSGMYKNILVVGVELQSRGINKTTEGRDIAVLFGDGAGAMVLSRNESEDSRIIASDLHSDGRFAKELWISAPGSCAGREERLNQEIIDKGEHFPYMNGKVVFVHAIKKMSQTVETVLKKAEISKSEVGCYLFHQANLRINQKVQETLGLADEQVFNTIQKYGNTTAATIPIGLADALKEGKIKRGDYVVLAAFGSGFSWGSIILKY